MMIYAMEEMSGWKKLKVVALHVVVMCELTGN